MPEGGDCNLGSINLSEYVYTDFVIDDKEHNRFDFDKFVEDVRTCVFALNDVLIEGLNRHPLQDQKDTVKHLRQIGLGIMGLGDMLTKLGIRYGSPESIALCNTIGYKMIRAAVKASVDYRVDEEEGTWMNEPDMYWDEKTFRESNNIGHRYSRLCMQARRYVQFTTSNLCTNRLTVYNARCQRWNRTFLCVHIHKKDRIPT